MTEDAVLLQKFVAEKSEAAFRELVRQRIDFVYAAALRQVGGDVHLAQEVTQGVFLDLARKARTLMNRPSLAGWLYTSARFAAAKALRSRSRRMNHETEAHAMEQIFSARARSEIAWDELRPVLDAAVHELNESDREAILLRYFEGRAFSEVGAAVGLAENSARMRVERALEKLRERLARRGITSTAAALGVALAGQPAVSAPAGFGAVVAGTALAGATFTVGGIGLAVTPLKIMSTTKLAVGALAAVVAIGAGAYLGMKYQAGRSALMEAARSDDARNASMAALREENRRLAGELARVVAASTSTVPPSGWRVLADLKRKKLVELDPQLAFISPMGRPSNDFVKLFELNESERQALQSALDKATKQVGSLEVENAATTRYPTQNIVVIKVAPFTAQGRVVYDELVRSLAQVLGTERNAAFLTLGGDQLEKAFSNFGAGQREVLVTYNPVVLNGPFYGFDSMSVAAGESNNRPWDKLHSRAELEERLGPIVQLLPPDFGDGK